MLIHDEPTNGEIERITLRRRGESEAPGESICNPLPPTKGWLQDNVLGGGPRARYWDLTETEIRGSPLKII